MQTIKAGLFILALALLPFHTYSQQSFPAKYDQQFKASSGRYLPGVDWQLLKAQCYQESRLKEQAVSPVGAKGVCQFMPATWNEVQRKLEFTASPFTPSLNIDAAAYYMGYLRNQWATPRPQFDRHSLALASYNAGLGNLLESQKLCGMATLYQCIADCLPEVTGHHSEETFGYVNNIWRYYLDMKL